GVEQHDDGRGVDDREHMHQFVYGDHGASEPVFRELEYDVDIEEYDQRHEESERDPFSPPLYRARGFHDRILHRNGAAPKPSLRAEGEVIHPQREATDCFVPVASLAVLAMTAGRRCGVIAGPPPPAAPHIAGTCRESNSRTTPSPPCAAAPPRRCAVGRARRPATAEPNCMRRRLIHKEARRRERRAARTTPERAAAYRSRSAGRSRRARRHWAASARRPARNRPCGRAPAPRSAAASRGR